MTPLMRGIKNLWNRLTGKTKIDAKWMVHDCHERGCYIPSSRKMGSSPVIKSNKEGS